MAILIQIRRDTAANWISANPTLAQGELGLELDTVKFKMGNGADDWNTLAYWSGTGTDHTHIGSYATGHFTFTIQSGDTWDNNAIPVFQIHEDTSLEITKVQATVIGTATPTLTFNLEERNYGSLNNAGTDIMATDLVADADGAETTDFANPSAEWLEANDYIVFTTGSSASSGNVSSVTCTVYYERTS